MECISYWRAALLALKSCFIQINDILSSMPLDGIAAMLGVWLASRAFAQYRKQKRSEAATEALVILNDLVDYILDIASKPGLYESLGYYPDEIPEIYAQNNVTSPERPYRLIFNKMKLFKKELRSPISKIAGKEAIVLTNIEEKLQKHARTLNVLLPEKIEENDRDQRLREAAKIKDLGVWCEQLKTLHKEAKEVLFPIINGKSWSKKIIIGLMLFLLIICA